MSFYKLVENSHDENNLLKVIKKGNDIDEKFWHNVIQLFSINTEDVANLFNCSSDGIRSGINKIKVLSKQIDKDNIKKKSVKHSKMLNTGDFS